MIKLTHQPIDVAAATASLAETTATEAGATVLFLGTVRELTAGRRTESLDYECYPEMAKKKLAELEAEARQRWELVQCTIIHRVGHLTPGEAGIIIIASAPHRQNAFEAARWLIDEIKRVVPIWKKENRPDGTSQWIHPKT